MSRPQNPLNFFRSYAYHHILIACDGTDTAVELSRESEITQFDHERTALYGDQGTVKFCPQFTQRGGRYVVIINGMSDTRFSIKSAKWASVLIPNDNTAEGSTHFRTMAVDGEIEIIEPLGVNFLNLINEITKSLGTDPNGVIFMLKTIFVGFRDDGESEMITNIRPLLFISYDITALFDVTGAEYKMAFVGVTNGAARLPHVSSIADQFTFVMPPGATLLQALKGKKEGLEDRLNSFYQEQKAELSKQAACSGLPPDFFSKEFIDVTYKINLHTSYNDYAVGSLEPGVKSDTGGVGDVVVKKGSSISVEGLIDMIMLSSGEVLAESKADIKAGKRFMHKITSSVETGPTKYIVTYNVERYQASVVPVDEFLTFEPDEGQGLEFDYIFTGRNVDIKSFDIKMQMGMAFLQTIAAAPSVPTAASDILNYYNPQPLCPGTGNVDGSGDQGKRFEGGCETDARNINLTRKKPFFLGQSVKDPTLRNKRLPGVATGYGALLARHAAFENIEARMVIHGNPQLLEETTQLPSDLLQDGTVPQVIDVDAANRVANDDGDSQQDPLRLLWPAVHRLPGYVKVNVYFPTDSMVHNPESRFNQDYAQNFWYSGWYFVYSINHSFADGEFTQEIEMFSLPTDSSQSELNSKETKCNTTGEKPEVQCITEAERQALFDEIAAAQQEIADVFAELAEFNENNRPPDKPLSITDSPVFDGRYRNALTRIQRAGEKLTQPTCGEQPTTAETTGGRRNKPAPSSNAGERTNEQASLNRQAASPSPRRGRRRTRRPRATVTGVTTVSQGAEGDAGEF